MKNTIKVACIGECMVELSPDKNSSSSCQFAFAGDTLNTATYLARQSTGLAEVYFVSVLGMDSLSDRMLAAWHREGLNTSLVGRHPHRLPGLYLIENDAAGERKFHYWRSDSAARTLFAESASPSFLALKDFDVLYLSGITLAILQEQAREELMDFLKSFSGDGGRIVFDSNYRPALWASRSVAADVIARMWSICTIGLPSLDDEMALFKDSSAVAVVERLASYGLDEFALKCGDSGVRICQAGHEIPSGKLAEAVSVVDTTGAGDSFNAAYLSARLRDEDVVMAAHAGHALALEVIGSSGAVLRAKL